MILENYVKAAAEGITKAVLDKSVEMIREDVKAHDAKTDVSLLEKLRQKLTPERKP